MAVVKQLEPSALAAVVVVAAIKRPAPAKNNALQALTSAALVLPGLVSSPVKALEVNSVDFQYSHYQEGGRDLININSGLAPIEVDTIHLRSNLSLADRIRFSFNYVQDTWSGATPVTSAPIVTGGNSPILVNTPDGVTTVGASPLITGNIALNRDLLPLSQFSSGQAAIPNTQTVEVLSTASPETRNQVDIRLGYEWDEVALDLTGGVSIERDYTSGFGGIIGRWDLNQKLTSLNAGLNYTYSNTSAILDHDATPYITKAAYIDQIELRGGSEIFHGHRQDWATNVGISQVLNKNAVLDATLSYINSSGYLGNPYKVVTAIFVDPDQIESGQEVLRGDVQALMEQRPDRRNQMAIGGKYVQYVEPLDAAVHLSYQFSHDDWGINAHIFEADWVQPLGLGWTVTPRIRYYSQNAANFYQPYLTVEQAYSQQAVDDQGREIWVDASNPDNGVEYVRDANYNLLDAQGNMVDESELNVRNKTIPFDASKLPDNFSSDHRLSGFGALSGGLSITKQFSRGIGLQASFEYYSHAGGLKLGGGGAGAYANFDYYVASAALTVDLSAAANSLSHNSHHHGSDDHQQHMHNVPAGLRFAHMMPQADSWMIGYQFMYGATGDGMRHGKNPARDLDVVQNGCSDALPCRFTPSDMNMTMSMLNIMYAPTDWLNLMLMPQFVSKSMHIRELEGRPPPSLDVHEHTGIGGHETGGVGDTLFGALVDIWNQPGHEVHMGLMFSAPTGAVDLEFRRIARTDGGLIHFGMQLGSGTWDFLPSVTYNGMYADWSWGAQLSGTVRMQEENRSGYRLGNIFQATTWGNYNITPWLSASLRGVYTWQDSIHGDYNGFNAGAGPMDYPDNYGGSFWDVGFGLTARVVKGDLVGNSVSFEWLQPAGDDFKGYQLARDGALSVTWNFSF
ncbi:MAG: DUF3570 domain-containing protein [Methyloprofundus sp.]|uniref:DUF3570 domain-containing protein n=1 Tax=Methyloprofundus sp. TaxID=2020875 RepID=UPI00262FFC49|nr:DUF3570 domain-containing protein [Methyloprofundus sp.]